MTSLPRTSAPAVPAADHARLLGTVENGLHWVHGAVLRVEDCRARKGALPRVLAALTNITLAILRLLGVSNLKRTMRSVYRKG